MATELSQPQPVQPAQQGQRAPARQRATDWRVPPVDVYENGDRVLIYADLPGVATADLAIHLERQSLTIEGRRADGFGWRREFSLPPTLDTERITAELKAGVLTLTLPRSERARPRRIDVRAS